MLPQSLRDSSPNCKILAGTWQCVQREEAETDALYAMWKNKKTKKKRCVEQRQLLTNSGRTSPPAHRDQQFEGKSRINITGLDACCWLQPVSDFHWLSQFVGDPNLTHFLLLELCSVMDKPAGSEKIWLRKFCKSQSSIQAVAFHMVHGGEGGGVGQKAERTRTQTGVRP